jgi:hypothetical protein
MIQQQIHTTNQLLHRHIVDGWNVRPTLPRTQTLLDARNSDIRESLMRGTT